MDRSAILRSDISTLPGRPGSIRTRGTRWQPAGALLCALLALLGCDDDEPPPECAPSGEAWVELGTGERAFSWAPLIDGQTVELHAGIQGGYHVWGALKGDHFEPRELDIEFALFEGDRQVGGAHYIDEARRGASGAYELGGVAVAVFDDVDVVSLHGKTLRLALHLRSTDCAELDDEVTVVTRCCVELDDAR